MLELTKNKESNQYRLGFIVGRRRSLVVVDGQAGSQYDHIIARPAGGGIFKQEGSIPDAIVPHSEKGGVIFDSPHQLHYIARKGNEYYLVE